MGQSMLDVTVMPRLIQTLREERPDILQCNLIRANLYGKLAARVVGTIPVIAVAHNVERYMVDGNVMSCVTRFAERRTRAMAAAHVSVSNAVAHVQSRLLDMNVEEINVIANGIGPAKNPLSREESRRLLAIPSDALVVGTIGRLHAQKNYQLLLRAAAYASTHISNLHLVIIGDGEEGESLRILAAELGITSLVTWAGHRSDAERLVGALDIFVMTSDYEGLPVALLEAMRAGIPCLVTRAGGMPEAVINGETGYLVRCRDLEGAEQALAAMANDSALRIAMGRSAKTRFHLHYSAERMAVEYLNLYNQLSTLHRSKHTFQEAAGENH